MIKIYNTGTPASDTDFRILSNWRPETTLAIEWVKASDGNWNAIDRGSSSDVYEAEVTVYGEESYIDTILDTIAATRALASATGDLRLYNWDFDNHIFGENFNYSTTATDVLGLVAGVVDADVLEMSAKRQSTLVGFEVTMRLRALQPALTGANSLPSLQNLDIGYVAENVRDIVKFDTYDGTLITVDGSADVGIFEGTFWVSLADTKTLRQHIAQTRGGNYTIPNVAGVSEIFGPVRGGQGATAPYTAKLLDWQDLGMWGKSHHKFKLRFAEVV